MHRYDGQRAEQNLHTNLIWSVKSFCHDKGTTLKRSATIGRFVTKPLGKGKATKFANVEGVTTSSKSAMILKTYSDRRLKGGALRSATIGQPITIFPRRLKLGRTDKTNSHRQRRKLVLLSRVHRQ